MSAPLARPLDGGVSTITPSPYTPPSSITLVKVVIFSLAHAIILAILYLLCNLLAKCFRRTSSGVPPSNQNSNQPELHVASNGLIESLPLFIFSSVKSTLNGAENCAVCLSKFEPPDELRVLPLCCHAFHTKCIDTWIVAKQTCPLCRSTVLSSDSDVHDKFLRDENSNSGRFQIEIGIN